MPVSNYDQDPFRGFILSGAPFLSTCERRFRQATFRAIPRPPLRRMKRRGAMMHPEEFTRRTAVELAVGVAATARANALGLTPNGEKAMERVLGIGGFFLSGKRPEDTCTMV